MRHTVHILALLALLATGSGGAAAGEETVGARDLARWQLLGIGEAKVSGDTDTVTLSEGAGSKGVMLLSPKTYGRRVVVRFKVKASRFEGALVVLLSASASAGGDIPLPKNYDGNFAFWITPGEGVRNYAFAFHTGYHQPNAFVAKNPGFVKMAESPDTATGETWHDVEAGRDGPRLWLKVDGAMLLETTDTMGKELPAGHIALRARGPGDGSFSVRYKSLVIQGGAD